MDEERKPLIKKEVTEKIVGYWNIWMTFIWISCVLLLILLGSLHSNFNYPSTFINNLSIQMNNSFNLAGGAMTKIIGTFYTTGEKYNYLMWVILAAIFILLLYSIYETYKFAKKKPEVKTSTSAAV